MHKFDTHLITNTKLFNRLKSYEEATDSSYPVVFDVESDSKEEALANLYGFGVCFTAAKAFYVPIIKQDGQRFWTPAEETAIINWVNNTIKKRGVVGHNLVYDSIVYEKNTNFRMDDYISADTILMKHTVAEEPPFGLKDLAVLELGEWADKAQDKLKEEVIVNGGKWTKDQKDMYLASTETLGEYCCWDVILTKLLLDIYDKKLHEEKLDDLYYREEVLPTYKECTIGMKRKGFPVNMEHFNNLNGEIIEDIKKLEDDMYQMVKQVVVPFENSLLDKFFPVSNKGNFPKAVSELTGIPLPKSKKTGKITLAAKAIAKQKEATPGAAAFYDWVVGDKGVDINNPTFKLLYTKTGDLVKDTQRYMWKQKHGTDRVFNFKSNDHLIELFFSIKGLRPIEKTDKGKPKVNDKFIDLAAKKDVVAKKLQVFKKLNKIQSTYIQGIIDRQIKGIIYTSMLQFGTTSGRFSSRNPNLQNLPRPREEDSGVDPLVLKYTNAIREGFVAPKGYCLVDADYSSLEPRCFAHMSGDKALRDVYLKGEDLYSRIAIDVFKLTGVSANPKDDNYLKKVQPEFRQKVKVFCLAVPYGAEESRISAEMGVSYQEAHKIIKAYLGAYPNLRKYMAMCNLEAKNYGEVSTEFGRIRHLKDAKAIHALYGEQLLDFKWARKKGQLDLRRKMKNSLNNAKNFKIQGLAAHIVNRAMLAIAREFKRLNIDGYVALQVHDQIICVVKEEQKDLACQIVQGCMENTTKISIPLIAEPMVAYNLKESH